MPCGSKTAKITNKTKQTQTTTFKQSSNKDKTNNINTDTKLKYPTFQANLKSPVKSNSKKVAEVSAQREFVRNNSFTLASTASGVPTTEGMNTDTLKPKTKWLAKREQEMSRRTKLQTRTKIAFTKNEMYKRQIKDTHLLEKGINSGQKKLTDINLTSKLTTSRINCSTLDPLQRVSSPADGQAMQSMTTCKANANVSEQVDSPRPLTDEYTLGLCVKGHGVSVFKTKTCVWDHIKHGLDKRRHDSVPVLFPRVSAHNVSSTKCVNTSESALKHHTGNDQNTTMKNSPVQFPVFQTSVQRPVKDMLSSRVQNISAMAYSPEMATGYGGTFFVSSRSEMSSNENVLTKCQTSRPLPQSQGRVSSLENVYFTVMMYTNNNIFSHVVIILLNIYFLNSQTVQNLKVKINIEFC